MIDTGRWMRWFMDLIERQAAIAAIGVGKTVLSRVLDDTDDVVGCEREKYSWGLGLIEAYINDMKELPPAQSDIIRCNACKHWTQTTGNMPGFGLGDCDYLNAKFVNCNGYCYWAERREE